MLKANTLKRIQQAVEGSPRNGYVAELHLQIIKYQEELEKVPGREFCQAMRLAPSWGTEFNKMKKIAPRLRQAGLDPDKI